MSDTVIHVENLGKRYLIRHLRKGDQQFGYVALRDVLAEKVRRLFRPRPSTLDPRPSTEDFWALKDVSFEVKQGERVGIIGRNGAGKSTLLKILSRITEPSQGRVRLKGRVASLLEVGTGFHPELTGRENIFLNGAILGMNRWEIRKKFDEIVAFAEVEKFLDTPVKRYSSGMYVRLAFAVAAHLEPEILIVDEVLAVGDAAFQNKCLGKMKDVAEQEGRTVLFVSHNTNAIERLCTVLMRLDCGCLKVFTPDVRSGILSYLNGDCESENRSVWIRKGAEFENPYFTPERLEVRSSDDNYRNGTPMSNRNPFIVLIEGIVTTPDPAMNVGLAVYADTGELLFWSFSTDTPSASWPKLAQGPVKLQVTIPPRWLNEGTYRLGLLASLHYRSWLLKPGTEGPSVSFAIQGGLSDSPHWHHKRPGILAPVFTWHTIDHHGEHSVHLPAPSSKSFF